MFRTSKKELAETKGNIHKYLGLIINFSGRYDPNDPNKKGQFECTMYDYIEVIIDSAPPDMGGTAPDPIISKLFTVHETSQRFGTAQASFFHSMTARFMFAAKQAQLDIQVVVA